MASGKKRRTHNEAYMYDNLVRVRRPQIHQEAGYYEEEARTVSPQTKKNQRRAMKLGFGYVTFFAGAVAVALFVCFHYLGAQADLEQKTRKIESSVNLDEVQQRAAELGMVYAEDSQIVKYQSAGDHKIRQYESIPEDGEATDK